MKTARKRATSKGSKTKKTTKKGNSKIGATGRKIMAKAKEIRKKSPNKKWTTCVKEAAKSI